jgi:hypothetical protein
MATRHEPKPRTVASPELGTGGTRKALVEGQTAPRHTPPVALDARRRGDPFVLRLGLHKRGPFLRPLGWSSGPSGIAHRRAETQAPDHAERGSATWGSSCGLSLLSPIDPRLYVTQRYQSALAHARLRQPETGLG